MQKGESKTIRLFFCSSKIRIFFTKKKPIRLSMGIKAT